jgi:3',5'-cyclic AMP phosphodiesterase CpdA
MPQVFNLVHLTDFHLYQVRGASWRAFVNKRFLSYLSWRLHRGRKSSTRMLSAIIDSMPLLDWDQVAITGDLTHMGLPQEYRQARRFLERIGPPGDVFVIPGNHDAMRPPASATFFDVWDGYMTSGRIPPRISGPDGYPVVRLRKGAALIGLSSACPTPPFSAAGRLGRTQCRRLASILELTGRQRLFRVLLVHHPPMSGQVKPRKALRDAAELRTIIAQHGVELVLHGHTHHHSHHKLPGPVAPVPVFGLPSSTACHSSLAKRACLRLYAVKPVDDGWRIEVHDHRLPPNGCMRPVAGTDGVMSWHARPNVTA